MELRLLQQALATLAHNAQQHTSGLLHHTDFAVSLLAAFLLNGWVWIVVAACGMGVAGKVPAWTRRRKLLNETRDKWYAPPIVPSLPWIGSVFEYTRDPVKFVVRNHDRYGDAFTAIILGRSCTFVRSQPHITAFASASRRVLDVTEAYKTIAGPIIGEEAFLGQTIYLSRSFSMSRVFKALPHMWIYAHDLLEKISMTQGIPPRCDNSASPPWFHVELKEWLNGLVFGMGSLSLCGRQLASGPGLQRLSRLYHIMDGDLTLLGLVSPFAARRRRKAKTELFQMVKDDINARCVRLITDAHHQSTEDAFENYETQWVQNHEDPDGDLVNFLLKLELNLKGYTPKKLAEVSLEAVDQIREAVVYKITLVIYGLLWAAQTNTASFAAGVFYDILRHPQFIVDIRSEVAAYRRSHPENTGLPPLTELPITMSCIHESLRLRVTGAWLRLSRSPFDLPMGNGTGYRCPSGYILVSPICVNWNSTIYSNPLEWDPKRYSRPPFTSGSCSSQNKSSIALDRNGMPPASNKKSLFGSWGLGHAQCPGRTLAYTMICTLILSIFDTFDVEEDDFSKVTFENIVVAGAQRVHGPLNVRLRRRN